MEKNGKYFMLIMVSVLLGMMVGAVGGHVYTEQTAVIPEPRIIEKEVVVYVDKEPEVEVSEDTVEAPSTGEIVIEEEVIVEEPVVIEEIYEEEPVVNYQYLNTDFDITIPTNLSREQLIDMLGPSRSDMIPMVDAILEAEAIYGINALYLTATLGYESGWGRYYSGLNNIAGWKGMDGNFRNFDSIYECIMTVAEGLSTDFVYSVGPTLGAVALRYCPDYGYIETLLQIMYELENNI